MCGRTMGQVYCTSGIISYRPSILIYRVPMPLLRPHKTQRDKVLAAE